MGDNIEGLIRDDARRRDEMLRFADHLDPALRSKERTGVTRTQIATLNGMPVWDYEEEWGQT